MMELYYAIGAAALMAFAGVLMKMGVRKADADVSCGIHLIAYLLMIIFVWKWAGRPESIQDALVSANWPWVLIRGVILGVALLAVFRSLHNNNLNKVVPVIELSTVIYLGYHYIVRPMLGAKSVAAGLRALNVYDTIAVILLLIGLLVMASRAEGRRGHGGWKWFWYGLAAAVIVGVSNCYYGNHLLLDKAGGWDAVLSYAVAALLIWVVVLVKGKHGLFHNISFAAGILLCLAGVAVSGVVILIARGIGDGVVPVTVSYCLLLLCAIAGSLFLKERWTRNTSVGLLFAVASFVLYMI